MYIKKLLVLGIVAAISISFIGCGGNNSETETVSESLSTSKYYNYEGLGGSYMDSYSQRASLYVTEADDKVYINVSWSSSAEEESVWSMTAEYAGEGKLSYTDCEYGVMKYEENTAGEYESISTNEEGYFTISDGKLLWDGAKEDWCRDCVFEKVEIGDDENDDAIGIYEEEALPLVYEAYFLEEIDGEYVDTTQYLDLKDDYTGYWIAQDAIPITWDSSNIYDESGKAYSYKIRMHDYNADLYAVLLYVDDKSEPIEFMECYDIPKEIQNIIK